MTDHAQSYGGGGCQQEIPACYDNRRRRSTTHSIGRDNPLLIEPTLKFAKAGASTG